MADTDFVPLPGGDATALLASAYLARRAALIGERSAGRALPGAPLAGLAAQAERPPPDGVNESRGGPSIRCEGGVPVANRVEPGKRPRSSMAPLLVFDRAAGGPPVLVLGSPGGASIINYVAKALVATLDWGLDAQQALALPNFGSRNGPTELEAGRVSADLVRALEARGHALQQVPMTSGLQAIQRRLHDGRPAWFGATDPRGEGEAAAD